MQTCGDCMLQSFVGNVSPASSIECSASCCCWQQGLAATEACLSLRTGHIQRKNHIFLKKKHVNWTHLCLLIGETFFPLESSCRAVQVTLIIAILKMSQHAVVCGVFFYSISLHFKCRISSVWGESRGRIYSIVCFFTLYFFFYNIKGFYFVCKFILLNSIIHMYSFQRYVYICFTERRQISLWNKEGATPEGPFSVLLVLLASCSWIHRIDHVRFLKASCLHSLNL